MLNHSARNVNPLNGQQICPMNSSAISAPVQGHAVLSASRLMSSTFVPQRTMKISLMLLNVWTQNAAMDTLTMKKMM